MRARLRCGSLITRVGRGVAATLLVFVASVGCSQQSETGFKARDFVPEGGWKDPTSGEFYEKWFGGQLGAMNEPPMKSAADLAGNRERFRLLILPTFEPASAYRVDLGGDGSAVVRWAQLNGAGGYAPGVLACKDTFKFSEVQKQAFLSQVRKVDFASINTEKPGLCFDGTTLVFEHLDAHGQKMIVRHCGAEEMPLRNLVASMSNLKPRWSLQSLMCNFK